MVKVENNGNGKHDALVRTHLKQEKQRGHVSTKPMPFQYEAVTKSTKGPKAKC